MYVHLANGDVEELDADAMQKAFGDEPPTAFTKGGKQYQVIGVYPDGVEVEKSKQSEFDKSHEGHRK